MSPLLVPTILPQGVFIKSCFPITWDQKLYQKETEHLYWTIQIQNS